MGYLFGGPYNKGYSILGSILGSLHFGKLPYTMVLQYGFPDEGLLGSLRKGYPVWQLSARFAWCFALLFITSPYVCINTSSPSRPATQLLYR